MRGSGWCINHHPGRSEERRLRASKGGKRGGRGRPPGRETEAIKALLEDLAERVLAGDLETGRAAVVNRLVNTRLRAIEQERKIKETEELEGRIGALERAREEMGANRWRGA